MEQSFKALRGIYLLDRNAYIAAGEPAIFHCHHYNCFLQATLEDTKSYIDIYPILIDSAQEIVYAQMSRYFREANIESIKERKLIVEDYFSFCGFGKFSLATISESGGTVSTTNDHYGKGWYSKFGLRKKEEPGVSFFTSGYLAGGVEAIFDLPNGTLHAKQTSCIAKGDAQSIFEISKLSKQKNLEASPEEGLYQQGEEKNHPNSTVNYLGIREALINMPLQGSESSGLLDAFGVMLTRHYANYYGLISFRMLKKMEEALGETGVTLAEQLLTEAGHICAFNTFGGIMSSAEWEGMIKPMLQNKKDWIHGIVAVVNAFGWGIWEVDSLVESSTLQIKITSGYEANCYLKKFGKSNHPVSYLARGGTAGIMNLLYNGDITTKPLLDEHYYKMIFNASSSFRAAQKTCRTMKADADIFIASIPK